MTADPYDIFYSAQRALTARGPHAWDRAATYAASLLRIEPLSFRLGACDWATFARVEADPADPRKFLPARTAGAGSAAILMPWPNEDDVATAEDLIAISLDSGRFWRTTGVVNACWKGDEPVSGGRLRLRQNAREWLRRIALWRAGAVLPVPHPAPPPAGALILDPARIDWTRRGWMKDVDIVEIVDAPSTGALGAALLRHNRLIGRKHGPRLIGCDAPPRSAQK